MGGYENIRQILRMGPSFDWSVQGFGMFRCYLTDGHRLHVWDDRFKVPGVSDIHDHPWDLSSEIISGHMQNVIFRADDRGVGYYCQLITPGDRGGPLGMPMPVSLEVTSSCGYGPGGGYGQRADEIHRSEPTPGTVTLATRTNRRPRDVAHSYYPEGGEWVDAKPRPAPPHEVRQACELALLRWGE